MKLIPWAKPNVGVEELVEIKKSFKSNWLTQGPKVKQFEKIMSKYCNVPYAVAVSNGTTALDIAYKTIGIKHVYHSHHSKLYSRIPNRVSVL